MRIMFDVLGAPESSGGMRLYAESVISAWGEAAPDDAITVVGEEWIAEAFRSIPNIKPVVLPIGGSAVRILSQLFITGMLFLIGSYNAVVSVSPMVSPLIPQAKRFVVVHDWRHRKNPKEFGRAQRFYRHFWRASVSSAAGVFAISKKTARETRDLVPGARITLAVNGADHVSAWPIVGKAPGALRQILTFGHHSNKRPELLISALAFLAQQGHRDIELVVLGARGEYRDTLRQLAARLVVEDQCKFPGFVSDREYERYIQTASLVALVSSDEGYGLPVGEAGYFGIPCIATTDSGLADIHGDAVHAVAPTPDAVAEGVLAILSSCPSDSVRRPVHSWQTTAETMRSALISRT